MLTNKFMRTVFWDIEKSGELCKGEVDVLRENLKEFDRYRIECDVLNDGVQHVEFGISCAQSFYSIYNEQGESILEFDYVGDEITDVKYNLYPMIKNDTYFNNFRKWIIEKNLITFDVLALDNVDNTSIGLEYLFIEKGKFVRRCCFSSFKGRTPLQWWEDEVNRYLANLYLNMIYYKIRSSKLENFEKLLSNSSIYPHINLSKVDLTEVNRPEDEW